MAISPQLEAQLAYVQSLLQGGNAETAEVACRGMVEQWPEEACYWRSLGAVLYRRGEVWEGESCARKAVALDSGESRHWVLLGNCLFRQSRWAEAGEAFRQAIGIHPEDAATWNNLGAVALRLEQPEVAEDAFERYLAIAPDHLGAAINLTHLFVRRRQRDRAVSLLKQIMSRQPRTAEEWAAVGSAWEEMGNAVEATAAYRQALGLAPKQSLVRHKLAPLLERQRKLTEAERVARELLDDEPRSADAWESLGRVLHRQGRAQEAMAAIEVARSIAPMDTLHSVYLNFLQYVDDVDSHILHASHVEWDAAHAPRLVSPVTPHRSGMSDRPLRIGFVSANFQRHPVAFLFLRALECLDKSRLFAICYAEESNADEYTARFRGTAQAWRPVRGLTTDELVNQIRADNIDILFDLMGHTGHRLPVFARKPAPVQATWLGYVGTTGLSAMDYLLADQWHVPRSEESLYVERILRMPHGYACYGPPQDAPAVGPLPGMQGTSETSPFRFTFGCFNNPAKLSQAILTCWAEILKDAPQSHLLLKYGGLDDPQVQQRLRREFARRGVQPERIILEGWSPHLNLLATYNRIDLALDTQPYSGGVTTCEALWMGVPVVTCPGETFAGRVH